MREDDEGPRWGRLAGHVVRSRALDWAEKLALLVLCELATSRGDDRTAVSVADLAARGPMSESRARRSIRSLADRGLIRRLVRPGDPGGATLVVAPEAIAELARHPRQKGVEPLSDLAVARAVATPGRSARGAPLAELQPPPLQNCNPPPVENGGGPPTRPPRDLSPGSLSGPHTRARDTARAASPERARGEGPADAGADPLAGLARSSESTRKLTASVQAELHRRGLRGSPRAALPTWLLAFIPRYQHVATDGGSAADALVCAIVDGVEDATRSGDPIDLTVPYFVARTVRALGL